MDFNTTARHLISCLIFGPVLCKKLVRGACHTQGLAITKYEMGL